MLANQLTQEDEDAVQAELLELQDASVSFGVYYVAASSESSSWSPKFSQSCLRYRRINSLFTTKVILVHLPAPPPADIVRQNAFRCHRHRIPRGGLQYQVNRVIWRSDIQCTSFIALQIILPLQRE